MSYVIILVASQNPLSVGHLAETEGFIDRHTLGLIGKPRWLNRNVAAEIAVRNKPDKEQIEALRKIFDHDAIDVFTVAQEGRRKKLLLADMDSTIVTSETLDEMAAQVGIKDKIAPITNRAMRGELDFHEALRERIALLQGQPEKILHDVLDKTVLSDGADSLTHVMKNAGAQCVLVSGGFTFFTEAIARKAGFQHHHGNTLDVKDNTIAGTVSEPLIDKDAKLDFLRQYRESLELAPEETVAIGDGANDLPMLLEAGLGIGYHPKPLLREALDNCIIHGNLECVLYIQGFRTENTL